MLEWVSGKLDPDGLSPDDYRLVVNVHRLKTEGNKTSGYVSYFVYDANNNVTASHHISDTFEKTSTLVEADAYKGGYIHSSTKYPKLKVGVNPTESDGEKRSAILLTHPSNGAQWLEGCTGMGGTCPLTGNDQAQDLEAFLYEDFLDPLGVSENDANTYSSSSGDEIKLYEGLDIEIRYVDPPTAVPEDVTSEELF